MITDVARLAGVSHQTVSRVLNNHPNVRSATRARVMAAMRELDYRPNHAARALVTRRSQTLGVVSFDTTLYGPASTLYGIEQAAQDVGYFVIIASLKSLNRRSVLEAIERLMEQSVDGIIVVAPQLSASEALRHVPKGVPLVAIHGGFEADVPFVTVDNAQAALQATQHLLSLGHETVWHIAGPADWLEAQGRLAGWRAALEAAGADIPPLLHGDWSARSGYAAGKSLARRAGATAVFVANDHMALGVLRALHEEGLRVPEDLSVVGFDDIPEASYFTPPLTTLRQNFDEIGRLGLTLLLEQVQTSSSPAMRITVDSELIVRQSTGRVRSA